MRGRVHSGWQSPFLPASLVLACLSQPTGQHLGGSLGPATPLALLLNPHSCCPGTQPPPLSLRPFQGTPWLGAWSGEVCPTPSEGQSCVIFGAFPVCPGLPCRQSCLFTLVSCSQDLPLTSFAKLNRLHLSASACSSVKWG